MRPESESTALEYSNVTDRERLRATSISRLTCPNDPERPLRREFASRGATDSLGEIHTGVTAPAANPAAGCRSARGTCG
jgi:hypothetical protein